MAAVFENAKVNNLLFGDYIATKPCVELATTAPGTLATSFESGDTIDGIVLSTGNRILIKNQVTATENGIYEVQAAGAPIRSPDFYTGDNVASFIVVVKNGTVNSHTVWMCDSSVGSDTVGANNITFLQISGDNGVTPGSYTHSNITVDSQGKITAASDGTLVSAGGESLVSTSSGAILETKGLVPGAGISLAGDPTTVTITNTDTGSAVTLGSSGLGETLVNDGVGPALATKSLVAGTGMSLASDADEITITNTDTGSAVTLATVGAGQTLVNDGTGPALATKSLIAGTGMSLASDATEVTITNTDTGSAVTLASAGGTQTLVNDGTGPALATKGLTEGAGITLTSDATSVTAAVSSTYRQENYFFVNSATGSDANSGKSSGDPFETLEFAVQNCKSGGTIVLAESATSYGCSFTAWQPVSGDISIQSLTTADWKTTGPIVGTGQVNSAFFNFTDGLANTRGVSFDVTAMTATGLNVAGCAIEFTSGALSGQTALISYQATDAGSNKLIVLWTGATAGIGDTFNIRRPSVLIDQPASSWVNPNHINLNLNNIEVRFSGGSCFWKGNITAVNCRLYQMLNNNQSNQVITLNSSSVVNPSGMLFNYSQKLNAVSSTIACFFNSGTNVGSDFGRLEWELRSSIFALPRTTQFALNGGGSLLLSLSVFLGFYRSNSGSFASASYLRSCHVTGDDYTSRSSPIEFHNNNVDISDSRVLQILAVPSGSVPIYFEGGRLVFTSTNIVDFNTTNNMIRSEREGVIHFVGTFTFLGTCVSLTQTQGNSVLSIDGALTSTAATVTDCNFRIFDNGKIMATEALTNCSNGANGVINLFTDGVILASGESRLTSLPINIQHRAVVETTGSYQIVNTYAVATALTVYDHIVLSTDDITLPATATLPGLGKTYVIKNTDPSTNIVIDVGGAEVGKIIDNSATAVDTLTVLPGGTVRLVYDGTNYQTL